ncbi:testicular haploid expressed gene protein-like [Physella acuta]|uniref:testicular haploid expressed gene protein-like n=1 Tax=Physella acuta TaxID=109671 RepID=UPI0027DD97F1|nr:testicular haploid expressed gene protein-like [Physella acuta]
MAATKSETKRIDILAQPRGYHPEYRENRRSVYWLDREPPQPGPDGRTVVTATPRVVELSRHKTADHWRPDRPSAIWPVSDSAKSSSASPRVVQLSAHRNPPASYLFDRDPGWEVKRSALSASSTSRVDVLATPKRKRGDDGIDPFWGYSQPVSKNALSASCSSRLEALAAHKGYPKEFKDARSIQWPVSHDALEAIASLRLQQLARPPTRALTKDDYDPYRIVSSALRYQSTPRIDELALPIPRKVRTKRTVS